MNMPKKYFFLLIIVCILLLGGGFFLWLRSGNQKQKEVRPKTMTRVSRINELAIDKRPFVQLIPHPDDSRCDGISLLIDNLKNDEKMTEYELEYMAGSLIQGVFGRRDFTKEESHQPLELGSCSKGKCKCDKDITGGSLTLRFTAREEYTLKGDFSYQVVSDVDRTISSRDGKLNLTIGKALPSGLTVIVASTLGLPAKTEGEIVAGPYGIFLPEGIVPRGPMELSLQSKEENASLLFWDSTSWQQLNSEVKDGKLTVEINKLGAFILIKKD